MPGDAAPALLRLKGAVPARQPPGLQPEVLPELGAPVRRVRAPARSSARRRRRARRRGVPAVPGRAQVKLELGLALALGSAVALNWGFVAQHGAATRAAAARAAAPAAVAATAVREPALARRLLRRDRRLGRSTSGRSRSRRSRSSRRSRPAGSACWPCSSTTAPAGSSAGSGSRSSLRRRRTRPPGSDARARRMPRATSPRRRGRGLARRLAARLGASPRSRSGAAPGSESRPGLLYAAGDVATKAAVGGGGRLAVRSRRLRRPRPGVRLHPARVPAWRRLDHGRARRRCSRTPADRRRDRALPRAAPRRGRGRLRLAAFALVILCAVGLAGPDQPRPEGTMAACSALPSTTSSPS